MQHILEVCTFGICHESAPPPPSVLSPMLFEQHVSKTCTTIDAHGNQVAQKFETWCMVQI
jgi:hypothetical protein